MPFNPQKYQQFLQIEDQGRRQIEQDDIEKGSNKKEAYIWKAIRNSLSRFGFFNNRVDEDTVWQAHQNVLINYVTPLYESLENTNFPLFLTKVGLTDTLTRETLTKRIFALIQRIINGIKFPLYDDDKLIVKNLNDAVESWVSDVLGEKQHFPAELPSWTPAKFQIYLGYETLYIYLRTTYLQLANNIDPLNFYQKDWFKTKRGEERKDCPKTNQGDERLENIKKSSDLPKDSPHFQWTTALVRLNNPITYLALFSKAIHSFSGEAENGNTQNADDRQALLDTLAKEIEHLEPKDENNILAAVLKGKEAFVEYANQTKPAELGKKKRGNPHNWCDSSLFYLWGYQFCEEVYQMAQKKFAQNKILQIIVRDILVKPLTKENTREIEVYLEGGRKGDKALNKIMSLVDQATLPIFREIWKTVDQSEFNQEHQRWE